MSGIAGAFRLDGGAVAASDVQRMASASGRAGLAPLVSSSQTVVWFDGRLDNREEIDRLHDRRANAPDCAVSDAALVLDAYERCGDRFVGQLNGDFALALVDAGRQQLILARDVMAARSLYYCPLAAVVLFASEIKCLLADPRVSASPDEDGLAELVLDYWCDEHRTCFKGIYSVPAGHAVVVTRDGIERRAHWTFDPARTIRYGSFDEYRDHFHSLFEQSLRRRLRGAHPVAITVSGGVDSSSIFCQAATLVRRESLPVGLRGIAMTFPKGTAADEQEFLDELERRYDTPITRLPVSQFRFLTNADAVVRQLETPGVVSHTQAEILETARAAGCRVLLSGFFGDQMLFERGYLVDLARRGRWLKVRHDLREFAAWMTDVEPEVFVREFCSRIVRALPPRWLFGFVKRRIWRRRGRTRYPPWFTAAFRDRALACSSVRFDSRRRFASAHAEQYYRHTTAGHYENSVRCERSAGEMHGIDVRYPFRDRDLVAFLMAIPGEIVNWQGIPKGLLRQALTGVLPDIVRDRRWKADFTALENQAVRNGYADLVGLLPRDCLAVRSGMVDGDMFEAAVRTFATIDDDDTALPGWRLTDVAGLELWLQHFFGGSHVAD